MQLPLLSQDKVQERCTAQSFERGLEYYHDGAIANPVLLDYKLSANCHGTEVFPYRVSVELMPTGIATVQCSCPYSGAGDCKHIVALLLTYIRTPETVLSVDTLLTTLETKPKSDLIRVISELLKQVPELAPVAQVYADVEVTPTCTERLPLVAVYMERIDAIFGRGFLEQHQLRNVLIELENLLSHATTLLQSGEAEIALSILHALIHQSIVRYPDTLQKDELPRFVKKCTELFAQVTNGQESNAIDFDTETVPATVLEHCKILLQLSFNVDKVFVPILTHLLGQVCLTQEIGDLQALVEQSLDESPDRQAHVQLLLDLYRRTGQVEEYLCLARCEGEGYQLIHMLFTHQQDDAAWEAIEKFTLSIDEYSELLRSPIVRRIPEFTNKLLALLTHHTPDIAIDLYQEIIDKAARQRRRENYEKVHQYLMALRSVYCQLDQQDQWCVYLEHLRESHSRKRLLLQLISDLK